MTIAFPFAAILIPYAVVLFFFVVFACVNVWHLVEHGATTGVSFVTTFLFLAGATTILFFTWQEVQGTNWMAPVEWGLATKLL